MTNVFDACVLPWRVWPWGLDLRHADTDTNPKCTVECGVTVVEPEPPYSELWARLEFRNAAFASSKPHRDDEILEDVSGYDIVPRRREFNLEIHQQEQRQWLESGICLDPGIYWTTSSTWLTAESDSWAYRQRGDMTASDAVHFIVDGRDGYIEILASGFTWQAWPQGHPLLGDVEGEPSMTGTWTLPRP